MNATSSSSGSGLGRLGLWKLCGFRWQNANSNFQMGFPPLRLLFSWPSPEVGTTDWGSFLTDVLTLPFGLSCFYCQSGTSYGRRMHLNPAPSAPPGAPQGVPPASCSHRQAGPSAGICSGPPVSLLFQPR